MTLPSTKPGHGVLSFEQGSLKQRVATIKKPISAATVSRCSLALRAYRVGTGIGGRNEDRDVPAVAAAGFAPARDGPRFPPSTDSR
jgi:hypothetical protein